MAFLIVLRGQCPRQQLIGPPTVTGQGRDWRFVFLPRHRSVTRRIVAGEVLAGTEVAGGGGKLKLTLTLDGNTGMTLRSDWQ